MSLLSEINEAANWLLDQNTASAWDYLHDKEEIRQTVQCHNVRDLRLMEAEFAYESRSEDIQEAFETKVRDVQLEWAYREAKEK